MIVIITQLLQFCRKKPKFTIIILLITLTLIFYCTSTWESDDNLSYTNVSIIDERTDDDPNQPPKGYLVWNSKCHMPNEDPMDPSIWKYVKKYKSQACTLYPPLSSIREDINGTIALVIDKNVSEIYANYTCCWRPIYRPTPNPESFNFDSKISAGHCHPFQDGAVILPLNIEVVYVSCRSEKSKKRYKNVHAILQPLKVQDRVNKEKFSTKNAQRRKLSVLILGIDSVSRLNFLRSLPNTEKYLRQHGWINLRGYNKMADNTFPNLMAILTGQNLTTAHKKCKPTKAFGLDYCPFLWHNFRNAGYITAYGEDTSSIGTFNLNRIGFVNPPTDYYLRPYSQAAEKLLPAKERFDFKYCTGPEHTVDRIFNYATHFAKTFFGLPYFGFFWTNAVTHNDVNGLSTLDMYLLQKLKELEQHGVFNDSMVIFLSDHGMRFGAIRDTFIGWYAERLPFIYINIPEWYTEGRDVVEALKNNEYRLTSPYDLYETLRDVVMQAGGVAASSSGCPTCQSLFKPVPSERGCDDVGVTAQWCTCTSVKNVDANSKIARVGAGKFLDYIEGIVETFKDANGRRLCAKLSIKQIHHVKRIIDVNVNSSRNLTKYNYKIEMAPGGALYEIMMYIGKNETFEMPQDEISRINSYDKDAECLNNNFKKYCYCLKK